MADDRRRTLQHLIRTKVDQQDFVEFHQLVRILERYLTAHADVAGHHWAPVGHNAADQDAAIAFRTEVANRTQPASTRPLTQTPDAKKTPPIEVVTTFLSLFGSCGILPQDYTSLILERVRAGDDALRNYLDVFQQRLTELTYQIWERTRPEIAWERIQTANPVGEGPHDSDKFAALLRSLAGLPHSSSEADNLIHQARLYFSAHFATARRPALSLEAILTDYFDVPVTVRQFCPRQVLLPAENQWRLQGRAISENNPTKLGQGLIVGQRVSIIQTRLLVRLGPLHYHQFQDFLTPERRVESSFANPHSSEAKVFGRHHRMLRNVIRGYVGLECEIEIELLLDPGQKPEFRLGQQQQTRLGWNSWTKSSSREADNLTIRYMLRD